MMEATARQSFTSKRFQVIAGVLSRSDDDQRLYLKGSPIQMLHVEVQACQRLGKADGLRQDQVAGCLRPS